MGSLIEELQRREAAARQEVDELRGEITRLTERLTDDRRTGAEACVRYLTNNKD